VPTVIDSSYKVSTNEFAVLTPNNIIRTYFKPEKGLEYFLQQLPFWPIR
jgi:pyocin large subunit-like protein